MEIKREGKFHSLPSFSIQNVIRSLIAKEKTTAIALVASTIPKGTSCIKKFL